MSGAPRTAGIPSIDEILTFLVHLYDGLPPWSIPIYWAALVCILGSFVSLTVLIIRAGLVRRNLREVDRRTRAESGESDYLWVFLVPALNEEVTITDSVGRLREVDVTHRRILVINDGSSDRTGQILAAMTAPELTVLTRVPPNARQGKSEALNDAWRYLHETILRTGPYARWDPERVIVTIVDADGRLDREAWRVAGQFADERVGGVQSQVRIYNSDGFITWAQNLEFGVFGSVFQLGRVGWGTANMGGNGQFNRLAALDSVAVVDAQGRRGPWLSGRLTEDQDIGLRLIHRGWRGAQSTTVTMDQQGLHSLRALYRQRTRWSQGAWQVLDLIWPSIRNPHLGIAARVDQVWYLLTPIVQAVVGVSVVLSATFLGLGLSRPDWSLFIIALFYVFSAAPGIAGVFFTRRHRGLVPFLKNLVLAHLYLVYSWMIYPVVYRALLRQLFGRKTWAKTKRESIAPGRAPVAGTASGAATGIGIGTATTSDTPGMESP